MTTIKLKNGSGAPATSDLVQGEPALDLTNKRLYTEDSGGTVIEVGTNPTSLTTGTFTSTGIDDNATSTAITIDSSENVGIGTTSPTSELTLGTNSTIEMLGGSSVLKFTREDTTTISGNPLGAIEFAHTDTDDAGVASKIIGEGDGSSGQGRISFHTGTPSALTERMRIDSSGNLTVGGTTAGNAGSINLTAGSPGSTVGGLQLWSTTSGSHFLQFGDTASGNGYYRGAIGYLHGSDALVAYSAGSERMRINSSGNVGIGTDNPQYSLSFGTGYFGLNYSTGKLSLYQANSTSHSTAVESLGSVEISSSITGSGSGAVKFNTYGSERMRIDSSGNLLVGTSSSTGNSGTFQAVRSNVGAIGYFEINSSGGAQNAVDIANAANAAFVPLRFWVNDYSGSLVGSISCTTSSTAYNTSSDERLKENIVNASAGNIDDIRVRSFDWKADGSHQPYGMVAQELVDVAPEAVTQGETDDDMWGVDYSKLVPMMIKEIQDLKAEVAALKGE